MFISNVPQQLVPFLFLALCVSLCLSNKDIFLKSKKFAEWVKVWLKVFYLKNIKNSYKSVITIKVCVRFESMKKRFE